MKLSAEKPNGSLIRIPSIGFLDMHERITYNIIAQFLPFVKSFFAFYQTFCKNFKECTGSPSFFKVTQETDSEFCESS